VLFGPGPGATPTPPELAEACWEEPLGPEEPPEVAAPALEAPANAATAQPVVMRFANRTV